MTKDDGNPKEKRNRDRRIYLERRGKEDRRGGERRDGERRIISCPDCNTILTKEGFCSRCKVKIVMLRNEEQD